MLSDEDEALAMSGAQIHVPALFPLEECAKRCANICASAVQRQRSFEAGVVSGHRLVG